MYLSDAVARSGRRNNFNLVRLLAALSVLVSHSFVLSTGNPLDEPFAQSLRMSLGSLAVVVFFITSGYLVGGSLLSRGEPLRFVMSRAVRIYPALIVVVVLTTFVLGPSMTTLPIHRYFTRFDTLAYLVSNATAVFGIKFYLPEVFTANPYRGSVNGALWTLKFELWMYLILLGAWFATARRGLVNVFAALVFGLIAVGTARYWQQHELVPDGADTFGKLCWLTPMFFLGVAIHLLRSKILLHWSIAALACVVLVSAGLAGPIYFKAAYPVCLAYVVLFAVYELPVVQFVQHRDYSYGLYIYSVPIQQTLAHLIPGISPLSMAAACFAIALACASASWHFIEKPSLAALDRMTAKFQSVARWLLPNPAQIVSELPAASRF